MFSLVALVTDYIHLYLDARLFGASTDLCFSSLCPVLSMSMAMFLHFSCDPKVQSVWFPFNKYHFAD